jgi:hypothetical protein
VIGNEPMLVIGIISCTVLFLVSDNNLNLARITKDLNTSCYFYNDMVRKITILNALEPFLSRPKQELHLAEISRIIGEPHPTTRQWLNSLQKRGVLLKESKGRLTLYKLDLSSYLILSYIIIAEKDRLIRKCEKSLLLKELVNSLTENLDENAACLIFGSSTEDFDKAGDIDLLIAGKTDETKIRNISSRLNKKLHIINVSRLSKVSKALKEEIIKKHLVIQGSESIMRWLVW